jgi:HEAT repeat protein
MFFLSVFLVIDVGCSTSRAIHPASTEIKTLPYEEETLPTPAKQLDEVIRNISSDDPGVRLVSIRALANFGDEAIRAIPALRKALLDRSPDIQINAAIQLGRLGSNAVDAVPDLQAILEKDMVGDNVRAVAARSLGEIGSPTSVPSLAKTLYVDNEFLAIDAAEAIAKITGIHFTESGNQGIYSLNDQGIPYIVIDARKWWQEKGQYQDWKGEK